MSEMNLDPLLVFRQSVALINESLDRFFLGLTRHSR